MRALRIAATGMAAQQLNVETISNNIANMNTIGFKKQRAEFPAFPGPVVATTICACFITCSTSDGRYRLSLDLEPHAALLVHYNEPLIVKWPQGFPAKSELRPAADLMRSGRQRW